MNVARPATTTYSSSWPRRLLRVLLDDVLARLGRRVGVDPERGDAEVLAQRRPAQRARPPGSDSISVRLATSYPLIVSSSARSARPGRSRRRRRRAPPGSRRRPSPRAARSRALPRRSCDLGAQLVVDRQPLGRAASCRRAGRGGRRGAAAPRSAPRGRRRAGRRGRRRAPRSRRPARRRAAPPTAGRAGRRPRPGPRRGSSSSRSASEPARRLEGLGERVDGVAGDEDVPLRRVARRRCGRLPSRGTPRR